MDNPTVKQTTFITVLIFILTISVLPQNNFKIINSQNFEVDKCGFPVDEAFQKQNFSPEYMGYTYDSLLVDLDKWRLSEYVKIDSIGLSVQGRPLWQLTVSGNPNNVSDKRTIHIHARTHPQETEGFYVTREMIKILISESDVAQIARSNCVFYIIPMYNPDGVVLGLPRRNANDIDLESNWNTFPHQPEVAALKARFIQLMASEHPIEVMLNMHSSSDCKRYFVYHHENGTSPAFAVLEQNFINGVRAYYPNGIEPFTFFVSWTGGTALQYPESWFWINHGENVMALTYEDMYQCSLTGNFDITANAILRGTLDYMNIPTDVDDNEIINPYNFALLQNYPNPFNPSTRIRYSVPTSPLNPSPYQVEGHRERFITLKVYDILGNEIATLVDDYKPAGEYEVEFEASNNRSLSSGIYFYQLKAGNFVETKKMVILR
ncbi:MAG: M14 family zinc carboxypeptidase [Ignavibacteriaceae bacterium]|nr:M14 family zinc carboxypeptidase [Ignavibacteriaceae bacterium]